ncbi:MAG: hypothetical protein ACXWUG_11335 [Polyangiales bacterium]
MRSEDGTRARLRARLLATAALITGTTGCETKPAATAPTIATTSDATIDAQPSVDATAVDSLVTAEDSATADASPDTRKPQPAKPKPPKKPWMHVMI